MAIATTCPNCKALFRLADEMAGRKVKCQKCAQVFTVATADAKADPDASVKRAIDMEIDAPKAASAPPDDEAPPRDKAPPDDEAPSDGAVTADEEPAAQTSKKAPPPPIGKKSRESSSRTRREPSESGSNTTLIAIILVVLGGGLFVCAGTCGVGGLLYYTSEDKPAKAADPGPVAVNKDGAVTVTLAGDGTFRSDNVLNPTDPRDPKFNKAHKPYTIRMTAGKFYQIDMVSDLNNGGFDSLLALYDDQNTFLTHDDDGGGFPNARILFQPKKTGNYRIHATHFGGQGQGNFMLFVRQTDNFGVIAPPPLRR